MSIKPGLRFQVLTRDQFTCQYCGRKAPHVELQVDHIVPKARGGLDMESNLTTACFDCNIGKSDIPLPEPLVKVVQNVAALEREARAWAVHEERQRLEGVLRSDEFITVDAVGWPTLRRRPAPYVPPRREQPQGPVPVATNFVYTGPDEFIPQFLCATCGMLNTYEGDMCGCRSRAKEEEEIVFCEDCGDELDEYRSDYDRFCEPCAFSLGEDEFVEEA